MDFAQFEKWFESNERKIWRLRIGAFLKSNKGLLFLLFLFIIYLIIVTLITNKIFGIEDFYFLVKTSKMTIIHVPWMLSIFGGLILGIMIAEWFFPFGTIESITILLMRISKQIEGCRNNKDKKSIKRNLNALKSLTKLDKTYPTKDLFKQKIEREKLFFDELKELPKKIELVDLKKIQINIFSEQLKQIAHGLHTDDEKIMRSLHSFSKDFPITKKPNMILSYLQKIKSNKWVCLFFGGLLLLVIIMLISHLLDIDRNTGFFVWGGLVASLLIILFKRNSKTK